MSLAERRRFLAPLRHNGPEALLQLGNRRDDLRLSPLDQSYLRRGEPELRRSGSAKLVSRRYTRQEMKVVISARRTGKQIYLIFCSVAVLIVASPPAPSQDSLPDLVRRIKPSAVAIESFDARGEKLSR